jgi:hypothetical protein
MPEIRCGKLRLRKPAQISFCESVVRPRARGSFDEKLCRTLLRSSLSKARWRCLASLLVARMLLGGSARADPSPKDPPADYKGTGQKRRSSPSPLLWIPRVLAAPIYVVSEFGLRQPMGLLIRSADFGNWPIAIYDFFTFDDHRAGILPTVFLDFGTLPSVGFFFFYNDLFARRNDLRLHVGTWGPEWVNALLLDRYEIEPDRSWVGLEARFMRRADLTFYGEGPESPKDLVSRYDSTRVELAPLFVNRFWRTSILHTRIGVRAVSFGTDTCCGDPNIEERIASGDFPPPDGYGQDYTVLFQRLDLALDSREERPVAGSGFRVEFHAEPAFQPHEHFPRAWIRYGTSVGGVVDLTGRQRNLGLMLTAEFADPLVGDVVPFNEQIVLGGGLLPPGAFMAGKMRGFRYGRLTDRSALVAELNYSWPIWIFLDGVASIDAGNVFAEHLEDFRFGLTRLTAVFGMRTNSERDQMFELLFGVGSRTFDDGAGIEAFRFVLGTRYGL